LPIDPFHNFWVSKMGIAPKDNDGMGPVGADVFDQSFDNPAKRDDFAVSAFPWL